MIFVLVICLALSAFGCESTAPTTDTIPTGPSNGAETLPSQTTQKETSPTETLPTETVPEETIPEETVPPQTQPTEPPAPSIQITGYTSDGLPIITGFFRPQPVSNGFFWSNDHAQAMSIHNGVLEILDTVTANISVQHKGKSYFYTFQYCTNAGNASTYYKQPTNTLSPSVSVIPGNDESVIIRVPDDADLGYTYLLDLQTMKTYDPLLNGRETFAHPISVREFTSDLQYALLRIDLQWYLLHISSGTVQSLKELTGLETIDSCGFSDNDSLYLFQTEGYADITYADCTIYNFKENTSYVLYTNTHYGWLIDIGGVQAFGPMHVHNHALGTGVCVIDSMTGTHTLIDLPDVKWHGRVGADTVYLKTWSSNVIYLVKQDGTKTPLFVYS